MLANVSGSMITLSAKSATVALTSATATVSAGTGFTADTTVTAPRNDLAKQYNTVITQLDALANTSGYKGTNLLQSNNLNVAFEGTTLTVQGFDASTSGLGGNQTATKTSGGTSNLAWSLASDVVPDLAKLEVATNKLENRVCKIVFEPEHH